MSKKWTFESTGAGGLIISPVRGGAVSLHGRYGGLSKKQVAYKTSPEHPLGRLLAVANRGAEAEQIEKAMLAMKAAGEKLRVYRKEDKLKASGIAVRCALGDLWDSLKLCPATAGDLKTARITSVEGKIKDAEIVLQAARTELKELKNV